MTISPDAVRLHLDYSAWANARLLEAAAKLSDDELTRDFGTADKSVIGTLVHIFGADRAWLRRVRDGHSGEWPAPEYSALAVLQSAWPKVYTEWREWSAPLTSDQLMTIVSYRDLRGNPWRTALWKILLHVVNHATHHRGQVSGFLRSMGHTPPPLDLMAFYRTEAQDQ